jgi:hypothetical protein
VRLRYARTLFEETENDLEAETALSKGVCVPLSIVSSLAANFYERLIFANE